MGDDACTQACTQMPGSWAHGELGRWAVSLGSGTYPHNQNPGATRSQGGKAGTWAQIGGGSRGHGCGRGKGLGRERAWVRHSGGSLFVYHQSPPLWGLQKYSALLSWAPGQWIIKKKGLQLQCSKVLIHQGLTRVLQRVCNLSFWKLQ